jgi:hypothetical protein
MAKIGTYPSSGGDDAAPLPITSVSDNPANPVQGSAEVAAPAAAAVIATTGALAAGVYLIEIALGYSGVAAAGKHITAQHRNAGDSANVALLGLCPAGATQHIVFRRVVLAANEFVRVVAGAVAGAAGEVAQAVIRAHKLVA